MDRLRLLALDNDDLAVVSATCQDAVVRFADCRYAPATHQFSMEVNRFVWERAPEKSRLRPFRKPEYERRRAVLHFNRVRSVRHLGLDPKARDQILSLLAVRFTENSAPSGTVELVFAGGPAIRLDVEVVEAQLTDIGGAWSTTSLPDHDRPDPNA